MNMLNQITNTLQKTKEEQEEKKEENVPVNYAFLLNALDKKVKQNHDL